MSYSITSVQRRPDIGFQSAHRHTAEGARELADKLAAEGALEIEVTDDRGNLVSRRELALQDDCSATREQDVTARLAPG